MTNTVRVALLVGGDSSERPVSFSSGKSLAGALSGGGFALTVFDVASPSTRAKDSGGYALQNRCVPISWSELPAVLTSDRFDVAVLSALHGGWGEDGTVQALLEVTGLPYVGSPPRASTLAMDKHICKALARELDLEVPKGMLLQDGSDIARASEFASLPCVVKPNGGGSSVAITLLREPDASGDALRHAVTAALADGSAALVEELIEGVEVTAAVLGEGRGARTLPLLEIVPHSAGGFYDYEAKYAPGGSQHLSPPRLPAEVQERVGDHALRLHRALGCRSVSRSDFIVAKDGTPFFLEINSQPGMTETSLVPDAARAAGMAFDELIQMLVRGAMEGQKP